MEQVSQMQLRDYVRALAKRWLFIVLFTLTVALAGGVYSLTAPSKFEASARVLLRNELPGMMVVMTGAEQRGGFGPSGLSLETYAKLLTSSENAKRVSQRLAARTSGQRIVVDPAEIVRDITAITEPPDVIRVDATAPTESESMAYANESADSFIVLVGDFQRAQETAARQFVDEQLTKTNEEVDRLVVALGDLRQRANMTVTVEPSRQQGETSQYVNLLQRYTDDLYRMDASVGATEARLRDANAQLAKRRPYSVSRHPADNPLAGELSRQLLAYQTALADVQSRYTPDHPAVQDLKGRITLIEKQLAKLPPVVSATNAVPDPTYDNLTRLQSDLQQQIADQRAQRGTMSAALTKVAAQTKTAQQVAQAAEQLQARLEMLRGVQERLVRELQVHKMNEAIKSEVAAVLDRSVMATPKTPRLSKMLIFSMVMGLAVSCALALLFELLDDTIRDPDDVKRYTDLAYLGMVPRMERLEDTLVVVAAPKSPYAEAYRSIRTQINFRLWERPGRAMLFTSALAGEGKTLTVCNVAAAYAQAGQKVLLVDADLRRPSAHKVLGIDNSRGLSNVIVGEATIDEAVVETRVPGLVVIPSGPLPPNPAELLESDAAKKVFEELKTRADIVLFDSPPCLVIPDASIIASSVDHALLVIQSGQLNARELRQAKEVLEATRSDILGVIVNRVPITRGGYYYYYYYYYYYGYGGARQQQQPPPEQPSAEA
jgi:capsular exopolysaccharide synthesis family protein